MTENVMKDVENVKIFLVESIVEAKLTPPGNFGRLKL